MLLFANLERLKRSFVADASIGKAGPLLKAGTAAGIPV